MLKFYTKYGKNYTYSQNGEEGIIEECLKRMKIETGNCFEAGGHDGRWCSNTALLIEKGWTAKFVEADFDLYQKCCANWRHVSDRVKSTCSFVDTGNINAFVGDDTDVVSLDTDGHDLEIFRAMKAKPKILIIEINSGFPPEVNHSSVEQGASYRTMVELGIEKGYFLLCHTGNLVFVDKQYRKLFPEIQGDGLKNADQYFNRSWLKQTA